jgi:hypothetical protein
MGRGQKGNVYQIGERIRRSWSCEWIALLCDSHSAGAIRSCATSTRSRLSVCVCVDVLVHRVEIPLWIFRDGESVGELEEK